MSKHDPLGVSDHCDECGYSEPECTCEENTMLNFKDPTWAHAELFGHSSYFGRVREVNFCGAAGLAIEPLTVSGFLPEFFAAGSAIFRLTPMAEDDVRHAVLPRAYRACETFQASGALPNNCRVCGRNEQEHVEEQQRKALPMLSERASSVVPEDLASEPGRVVFKADHGLIYEPFEEGDGEDDDIPFDEASRLAGRDAAPGVPRSWRSDMSDDETAGVFEDETLINAIAHHIRATPRHATEALVVMVRSGHDQIELTRAPLASSAATNEPLGDRARKALEGTPVANADILAATLRAPVGVVSAMLEEMGWKLERGLWMRPERPVVRVVRVADLSCDHGLVFDEQIAKTLSGDLVRERYPRLFGRCPKGCGYDGVAYVSTAHFVYGDW